MHHCHVALSFVINFSHFRLLLWSGIQRILTGSKISTSSTKFVLIGPIEKKQDGRSASYWLRHFRLLLWNHWMEFNETWKEARSQRPLPSLWFSGRSERQDGHPVSDWLRHSQLLLCDRYLEFNELGRKQDLNVLYQGCVFSADWKNKMATPVLIGWDILGFSSETDECNSTKFTGSKISTSSITFVFFGSIGGTW